MNIERAESVDDAVLLSATERAVAEIWREVLDGTDTLAASDNFFELGGTSIAMVTVIFRVAEELSVELAPGALFLAPSLREFAALIDAVAD